LGYGELNSKLSDSCIYSIDETKIGVTKEGKPIYRKIIKAPMTNFTAQTSGYASVTVKTNVLITQLFSVNIQANSNTTFWPFPYSGSGGWETWLHSCVKEGTQTSLKFYNKIAWGSAYTLYITVEYTKN